MYGRQAVLQLLTATNSACARLAWAPGVAVSTPAHHSQPVSGVAGASNGDGGGVWVAVSGLRTTLQRVQAGEARRGGRCGWAIQQGVQLAVGGVGPARTNHDDRFQPLQACLSGNSKLSLLCFPLCRIAPSRSVFPADPKRAAESPSARGVLWRVQSVPELLRSGCQWARSKRLDRHHGWERERAQPGHAGGRPDPI